MRKIEDEINELALRIAPDYPNIEHCSSSEKLHAIDMSFRGTELACKDLHEILECVQSHFHISEEECLSLWKRD